MKGQTERQREHGLVFYVSLAVSVASICLAISWQVGSGFKGGQETAARAIFQEDGVADELLSEQDIIITSYGTEQHTSALAAGDIDEGQAIATAQGELPFLNGQAASATLVSFTDDSYGPEVYPADGGEGVVTDPVWSNVTAYAVYFQNVLIPKYGPSGYVLDSQAEGGVYFIDATSGDPLEFVTIDPVSG